MLLTEYVLPSLSLAVAILSLVIFCYVVVKVRQFVIFTIDTFTQNLRQIFQPNTEGQPSLFGEILHLHSVDIGQEVGKGFQQGLTGSMGGTVKRANQEIEVAMAENNPELAQQLAFKKMLPKSMQKNDLVAGFMQSIFSQAIKVGGNGKGNNKNSEIVNNSSTDNMWG